MSKLREKFYEELPQWVNKKDVIKCEQIADDFAVSFAEWLLWQDITSRGKNNFVCADGLQRTTTELLQIFKSKYYE